MFTRIPDTYNIFFSTAEGRLPIQDAFDFSIRSTDIDGNVRDTEPIHVPAGSSPWGYAAKNLNIVYKTTDTVEFVAYKAAKGKTEIENAGYALPSLPKPSDPNPADIKTKAITGDYFKPIIDTLDIVLPAGNYAPADLCAFLNREINKNKSPVAGNVVQTSFLRNTGTDPTTDVAPNPNTVYFTRNDDGGYIFSVGAAPATKDAPAKPYNWLYGASQVTLDWNDDQGLFNWTYLHTPFYYLGKEVTGYATVEPAPPTPTAYDVNRYAGIAFASLGATTVKDGAKFDFWDAKLGFNVAHNQPGSLCVHDTVVTAGGITTFTVPTAIGVNVTANFTGADSLVNKSKPASGSPDTYEFRKAPEPADISSGDMVFNTSEYTEPILAGKSVFAQNLNFGYYLIEIDSNFANNFVDNTATNTKIKSVVSRYQSYQSYTAGSSDGSLIYVHKGAPTVISSFHVRILDSKKQLANNIGNDNTVFLNLVRAPPQPPAQKALPAPAKK